MATTWARRSLGVALALLGATVLIVPGLAAPAGAAPAQASDEPRITVTVLPMPEGYKADFDATGDYHRIDDGWITARAFSLDPDVPDDEWQRVVVWDPGGTPQLVPPPAAWAHDVSGRGHVVGGTTGTQPYLWWRGRLTVLPTAGGWGTAVDVNDRGQVAGAVTSTHPDQPPAEWRAAAWDRGRLLAVPDARPSTAVGINDRGDVALTLGWLPASQFEGRAAVWRPGGRVRELGTLGGAWSSAIAINERGDVVGASETADGATHGFLWRDGEMIDLGTLGGTTTQVFGVNDRGHVVGRSRYPNGQYQGFLWRDGEMIELAAPAGQGRTRPEAVNDRDQVIGESLGANSPFLWQDGRTIDLGRLGASEGFPATMVSDIDDQGRIVGSGQTWVPGAEPVDHMLLWRVG